MVFLFFRYLDDMFNLFYSVSLTIFILLLLAVLLLFVYRAKFTFNAKLKLILWNVLLSVFLLFFVFILGESYYRFFADTTDSFSINKVSKRWVKRHYQFNNRNLRDNINYEYKIANGKRRVSVLGDSFTAGHGLPNVDKRMGNLLRQKYSDTEVHVIAINGSNSSTELDRLITLYRSGYELDVVVLAYCLNDIDNLVEESQTIYKRIHAFSNRLNYIQQQSYFINMLSFRWFVFNDPDYLNYGNAVLKAYQDETWEQQKQILRQMNEVTRYANARFVVMTFPFLQSEKDDYTFLEVHRLIDNFWKKQGVPHLDLLSVYEPYLGKNLTVNSYDAHPNEFANQLAAEALETFLEESVFKRKH